MKSVIQADKFKVDCLKIMDDVQTRKYSILKTKRNKPIAKTGSFKRGNKFSLFGKMKGTALIKDDLIQPTGEAWDVCSEKNLEKNNCDIHSLS